jgi:hypothetical protein
VDALVSSFLIRLVYSEYEILFFSILFDRKKHGIVTGGSYSSDYVNINKFFFKFLIEKFWD